jgi:hypothetical protein
LFFLTAAVFGCSNPNTQTDPPVEINIGDILEFKKEVELSKIAKSIRYIPLETKESCLLGKIRKLIIEDSLMFISDMDELFVFNLNGQFIYKVSRFGRGPGEYINIWDFDISLEDNLLTIYSDRSKKVIQYDISGQLQNEYIINNFPSKIAYLSPNHLVSAYPYPDYYLNNNQRLSFLDSEGNNQHGFDALLTGSPKELEITTSASSFNRLKGSLTYFEQGYDDILEISEDAKVKVKYKIKNLNSSGYSIEENLNILKYFENKEYVFFPNCIYKGDLRRVVFDKSSQHAFELQFDHPNINVRLKSGFMNDIDGGYPFLPRGVTPNGELFSYFNVYDLQFLLDNAVIHSEIDVKENLIADSIRIERLLEKPVTDNPIIMIVSPL